MQHAHQPPGTPAAERAATAPAPHSRSDLAALQAQVRRMLSAQEPLAEILDVLVRAVEAHSEGDAVASVLILDAEGRLRTGAAPGLPAEYNAAIDGLQASPFLGTCSAAAATGTVVLTPDIEAHPYWASLKHLPLALGLVAAWSQPIIGTNGSVLGTLGTYFRATRAPTTEERALVAGLAASAAIAIEQAREGRISWV